MTTRTRSKAEEYTTIPRENWDDLDESPSANFREVEQAVEHVAKDVQALESHQEFRGSFREDWPNGISREELLNMTTRDAENITEDFRKSMKGLQTAGDAGEENLRHLSYVAAIEITEGARQGDEDERAQLVHGIAQALETAGRGDVEAGTEEMRRAVMNHAFGSNDVSMEQLENIYSAYLEETGATTPAENWHYHTSLEEPPEDWFHRNDPKEDWLDRVYRTEETLAGESFTWEARGEVNSLRAEGF